MAPLVQTLHSVQQEIAAAADELRADERALRFWHRMHIPPQHWSHKQYPGAELFWVIALLGERCLYFNSVEGGWGWGRYKAHGNISEYHYQQDEIHQVVFQTLFAIDHGGTG